VSAADRVQAELDEVARRGHVPGLQYVAVTAGTTLIDHSAGLADIALQRPMESSSTLMAYSMSKTITAAAVLQLVDAGRIALDDPLHRYVDTPYESDRITIRRLLTHTAGLPNPIPLKWVHPAAQQGAFDERRALADTLAAHPRASRPGTRYKYSNIGYWLLGPVVARASGLSFVQYVADRIVQPLGLPRHELGYAIGDPFRHAHGYLEKYSVINLLKGALIDRALIGRYEGRWLRVLDHYLNGPAFGGLVGTARAFARFLQDQLRPTSVLFGPDTQRGFYTAAETSSGRRVPMTLGWHVGEVAGARSFFKEGGGGGFHCMMRLYRSAGIGTVLMTNATAFNVGALLDRIDRVLLATPRLT
jgi:CubicO group peptidase (beta-lactamase class C family)